MMGLPRAGAANHRTGLRPHFDRARPNRIRTGYGPRGTKAWWAVRLLHHITGIATKRHPSARIFGSHVVLDECRSGE